MNWYHCCCHLNHGNVVGTIPNSKADLAVGELLNQGHHVCFLAWAHSAAYHCLATEILLVLFKDVGNFFLPESTSFLPESTSFLDHLIPSWAKRSLASGSSKTKPIVFPSIMTAFSLSFPNVPAFSSRSISLLRIPLAVATSPLILKIISKLKWRRFCPLDEGLHPGGDHPAALADVDGGLLLVSGQHPHVDLRSQQVGNCVRNPGNSIF